MTDHRDIHFRRVLVNVGLARKGEIDEWDGFGNSGGKLMVRPNDGMPTDCWHYNLSGTKKRIPVFDEEGNRICETSDGQLAEHAYARAKLTGQTASSARTVSLDT